MQGSVQLPHSAAVCRFLGRLILGLYAVLFTLAPGASSAASADIPLDFDEALRLAEMDAPAISAQEAAVDAAFHRVGPARELPDPELIFGIENLPVTGSDAWDGRRDDMTMRRIGVMQSLPRREKRELRQQRAEAEAEREQALLLSTRLETRETVANAWIAVAATERRLSLVTALRPQADALVEAAKAAISAGRGAATDAIAAEQARWALEDRIATYQLAHDQTRIVLSQWLPNDAARPLGAAPDWRRHPDEGMTDPERILAHRSLQVFGAMTRAAQAEVDLARAEKRSDWSVELAFADRGPGFSDMLSLQFRIGLPLFTQRRQDPLSAASEAALLQLESERDTATRALRSGLRQQEMIWRSAVDRIDRYEHQLLPLGESRVTAALAAYRGGSVGLNVVLSAIDEDIEQRIAYTEVLESLGQSWVALAFAFPEER